MLPEIFKERMNRLLGEEAEKLFFEIENGSAVRSFRVNKIKCPDGVLGEGRIDGKKANFPPECFYTEEQHPGSLACHHSGQIYMQDPSAMATIHAVAVKKGSKVLDSCSAPGGKTTQLAALVGDDGLVVANEYDTKRCRILQSNVERMGCRNTIILNHDTKVLAETYPEFFDLVLCDAPCSGEGMFRKNELAISDWSEGKVADCAKMQKEILANVEKCVAPGGYLIYSTCTFSLEENEYNVDWFLSEYPEFSLCRVNADLEKATSDGISFDGAIADMTLCRRFYPHISKGEGQFIALFKRNGESSSAKMQTSVDSIRQKLKKCNDAKKSKESRDEITALEAAKTFIEENLTDCQAKKLVCLGGKVYLAPDAPLPQFGVFASGVCVGELERGRFVPHHQLFSAYGEFFRRKLTLSFDDARVNDYLCGLEISAEGMVCENGVKDSGFAAILVDRAAVGGGKVSGGVCKNHYPKGLRK